MKNCLLIFLAAIPFIGISQLHPFTDPEFGRFDPKFLHQGYLIGNKYTETGVFDGMYKLSLSNGETQQFSFGENGEFEMPWGVGPASTHQDDIYVWTNSGFRKISVNENYVYDNDSFETETQTLYGTIYNGRSYWYSTWHQGTFYYNLDNGETVNITGWPDPTGPQFSNFIPRENYMFAVGTVNQETGEGGVIKLNFNHDLQDFVSLSIDESQIVHLHTFYPNTNIITDGRDILLAQMSDGFNRLVSISSSNIQNSHFISENLDINVQSRMNYIILRDGILFSIDNEFYKTNGVSNLEQIHTFDNLGTFDTGGFHTPSPYNLFQIGGVGNNFVQVENTTYLNILGSDQIERIYKMNSIHDMPELIYSAVHEGSTYEIINHAIEWNGNLLFVVQDNDSSTPDKIYLYNGTELILNPDLNDFSGRNINEPPIITGLFTSGELLLVNTEQGVYSIEYDEMSVSDQNITAKLKIYPNPVKDILHLSEKASEIKIYDLSGKLIKTHLSKTDKLHLIELPKGNYILSGINERGEKFSSKFVKQ